MSAQPVVQARLAGFARRPRARRVRFCLAGLLVALVLLSVGRGAVVLSPLEILQTLAKAAGASLSGQPASAPDDTAAAVLLFIRLPRVLLGALVGAALGMAGATMQGMFRNPLADPGLVGVSSGAALAAVTTIVLGGAFMGRLPPALAPYLLPSAAFLGSLGMTALVSRLASREGRTVVALLILVGVALGALAGAFTGFLIYLATDSQLRDITFWGLGSVGRATWALLLPATPFLLAPLLVLPRYARALDLIALGEAEAGHAGIDVERVKRRLVVLTALGVGAAVATCGTIGFIGLLVPHLLRLVQGPGHRQLLPNAAWLGAIFLLAADLLARTLVVPSELPVGVLTACAGAPFLVWLLLRRRGLGGIA